MKFRPPRFAVSASQPRGWPRALGVAWAVLLGACSSSPPEHFFTLTPSASSPAGETAPGSAPEPSPQAYLVGIQVVSVPEWVDRPQLAVRSGSHGVNILEQQRWAESLGEGVARALAAQLNTTLPALQAAPWFAGSPLAPALVVRVRVLDFDAVTGADAAVDDALEWRVDCPADPAHGTSRVGSGRYRVSAIAPGVDAASAEALVRAHALALGRAARQLSSDVETLRAQCRPDARVSLPVVTHP